MTASAADAMFDQQKSAEPPKDEAPKSIPRDRWGRPKIVPVGGGKPVPYVRVSTMAKALDDNTALGDWKARMTGYGVSRHVDLQTAFASIQDINTPDGKTTARELAEQAQERAKASAKRVVGTGFHSLTEAHDRGTPPEHIPPALADLYADYLRKTEGVIWRAIEQFVVVDELQVAGTADRVGHRPGDAKPRVWDVKTGRVDYGQLAFAVQLACYAHGQFYNPATGERRPWPEIDLEVGYILHADPETGIVTPYEVDLTAGWHAAHAARHVYDLRRRKDIMQPATWGAPSPGGGIIASPQVMEAALSAPRNERQFQNLKTHLRDGTPKSIMQRLAACETLEELNALFAETGSQWEDRHRIFANEMVADIQKRSAS